MGRNVVADTWPTAYLWPDSSTDRYRGLLHELRGQPQEAVPLYRAANRRHRAVGLVREEVYTSVDLARALRLVGRSDEAANLTTETMRRARAVNMVRAEEALRQLAVD